MAIDVSTTIPTMNLGLPSDDDVRAEGAGQIRHIKKVLVDTFPKLDGAITVSPSDINTIIPQSQFFKGQIMLFAGYVFPTKEQGWVPCDGNLNAEGVSVPINGVLIPDLRDKFIKGSNSLGNILVDGNSLVEVSDYLDTNPHKLSMEEMPGHDHMVDYVENETINPFGDTDWDSMTMWFPDVGHAVDQATNEVGGGLAHNHGFDKDLERKMNIEPDTMTLSYIIFVGAGEDT